MTEIIILCYFLTPVALNCPNHNMILNGGGFMSKGWLRLLLALILIWAVALIVVMVLKNI